VNAHQAGNRTNSKAPVVYLRKTSNPYCSVQCASWLRERIRVCFK